MVNNKSLSLTMNLRWGYVGRTGLVIGHRVTGFFDRPPLSRWQPLLQKEGSLITVIITMSWSSPHVAELKGVIHVNALSC